MVEDLEGIIRSIIRYRGIENSSQNIALAVDHVKTLNDASQLSTGILIQALDEELKMLAEHAYRCDYHHIISALREASAIEISINEEDFI